MRALALGLAALAFASAAKAQENINRAEPVQRAVFSGAFNGCTIGFSALADGPAGVLEGGRGSIGILRFPPESYAFTVKLSAAHRASTEDETLTFAPARSVVLLVDGQANAAEAHGGAPSTGDASYSLTWFTLDSPRALAALTAMTQTGRLTLRYQREPGGAPLTLELDIAARATGSDPGAINAWQSCLRDLRDSAPQTPPANEPMPRTP